ncbi:adenylate kinase, chloroplastic [Olea europaea subsp. europaea]|uniref:adenylate kinase n=1 Tax=Olea europaea subsp. europaea TaxID=158383 RepID=A0A8S0U9P0_OLEEU|nr:adenylate kinase, chloroplastic [Olea europaea subsp. europaea]
MVVDVKERLLQPDSQEKGWLLDGYPRSSSQSTALKGFGFKPHVFILLEILLRGKNIIYSPRETEEIAAGLTQRFDDTEEKVKLRLVTHNKNVEAELSMYEDITVRIAILTLSAQAKWH